jgi:hypothetical protein
MNALEVAQCSIDAWNRHDTDALGAQYAEGGTYHTPAWTILGRGEPSPILPNRCGQLFPTCRIISCGDTGGGLVATQLKP